MLELANQTPFPATRILCSLPTVTITFHQCALSKEKIVFSPLSPKETISCIFNLEGEGKITACGNYDIKAKTLYPGSYILISNKPGQIHIVYLPEQKVKIIELQVIPERLLNLRNGATIGRELHDMLNSEKNALTQSMVNPITPNMQVVLQQIIGLHRNYPLKELFYTSKVFELLSYILGRLGERSNGRRALSSPYQAKIYRAQEILEAELDDPPSLEELAKRVGMSTPHFKRIFSRLAGITPYSFLRQKRMELALSLLANGYESVGAIADMVGYKSLSHFTKVFTQYFGANPSSFRK